MAKMKALDFKGKKKHIPGACGQHQKKRKWTSFSVMPLVESLKKYAGSRSKQEHVWLTSVDVPAISECRVAVQRHRWWVSWNSLNSNMCLQHDVPEAHGVGPGSTTSPESSDGAPRRPPPQRCSPPFPHIRPARLEPGADADPKPAGAA